MPDSSPTIFDFLQRTKRRSVADDDDWMTQPLLGPDPNEPEKPTGILGLPLPDPEPNIYDQYLDWMQMPSVRPIAGGGTGGDVIEGSRTREVPAQEWMKRDSGMFLRVPDGATDPGFARKEIPVNESCNETAAPALARGDSYPMDISGVAALREILQGTSDPARRRAIQAQIDGLQERLDKHDADVALIGRCTKAL